MKKALLILFGFFALLANAQNIKNIKSIDLDNHFKPHTGSFVLLNLNTNEYHIYNDSIASKRFSPCSSFKIANSLIGLESEVAGNENYTLPYDSLKTSLNNNWQKRHWGHDHTMKTAIQYSVVWYYQELARRVGEGKMTKLLAQIDYGNNDISSGIDNFWLCGSLKVSAKEQVEFLSKLYKNQVPGFSVRAQETAKSIIPQETIGNSKLYGKTGSGDCWDNKVIGWYVGFVETETNTYIFAMNMLAGDFSAFANNKRVELVKDVLRELEIIK